MTTSFDLKSENKNLIVSISGKLTEETQFPVLSRASGENLIIDLENIKYLNSGGIRAWIAWMTSVRETFKGATATFKMLTAIVVRQAAQVSYFLPGGAAVDSFIAPYYCYDCRIPLTNTYRRGENWDPLWTDDELENKLAYFNCTECQQPCEIDVSTIYFMKLHLRNQSAGVLT